MIISPQSLDTNLSQLLAEVKSGSMQLPEFQRDWTWDDNRIRGIIASLSQGYPMGAIMRLQYGNPDIQFKYRTITGVKGVSVKPEHLILDGQQRLTSIYQATSSKEPVSTKTEKGKAIKRYYYLSMEKCLDDDEDRFDAVLSIPEDRKIKENFDRDVKLDLSTREYEYENKLFPVNIVFDSNAVMDWFMGYMTHYGMKPEAMDEFKRFQADVLNTISGYKLPVITLDKSTPREAVCKVFENVNTGGVPLTVFELVTATYATRDFDLRKDWVQCRNTICGFGDTLRTDLFDGIDETTFLTTVCLYTSYLNKQSGKTNTISCKKKDVLGLPYESYIANRDAVLSGFKIAKEFLLRDQCVFRQRDLPYTTQLIPLAAICAVLGKSKCNEPNTIKTLSRWYWCGILGEMYGGANETRYAYDIEDMVEEVNGRPNAMHTINSAVFSSTRLLTLQTRLSAAYKGIAFRVGLIPNAFHQDHLHFLLQQENVLLQFTYFGTGRGSLRRPSLNEPFHPRPVFLIHFLCSQDLRADQSVQCFLVHHVRGAVFFAIPMVGVADIGDPFSAFQLDTFPDKGSATILAAE